MEVIELESLAVEKKEDEQNQIACEEFIEEGCTSRGDFSETIKDEGQQDQRYFKKVKTLGDKISNHYKNTVSILVRKLRKNESNRIREGYQDKSKAMFRGIYMVHYATKRATKNMQIYDPYTSNDTIRNYLMLALILYFLTGCFNLLAHFYSPKFSEFFRSAGGMAVFFLSVLLLFLTHLALFLLPCSRKMPQSLFCLVVITLSMSTITACLTAKFQTSLIIWLYLCTSFVLFIPIVCASIYYDLRRSLVLLLTVVGALIISSIVCIVLVCMHWILWDGIWLVIACCIFSVCIIKELQIIIHGRIEMNRSDYTVASYMLYMAFLDMLVRTWQTISSSESY